MKTALLASAAMICCASVFAQNVVNVPLEANIQSYINSAPGGSTIQLSAGTYSGQQFQVPSGDTITGAPGGGTILNGNGLGSPMLSAGGATNVTVSNLSVTNYQTGAQEGPIHTGAGWQILNVTSTGNGAAGLYVGGPNNLVSGGSFSNNGQEGIAGSQANGSTIENTTISGNNTANFNQQWEAGGLKITATNGLTIKGNTVSGNNGNGIWGDIGDSNWTITQNGVSNNAGNGVMYEISFGNTGITDNLITGNTGSQVYVSNSSGVTVSGNGVEAPAGQHIQGDGTGGGIVAWDNSGRGSDPNGVPYLSNNDTVTGNQIIGSSSDSGIRSVIGNPTGDTFANNTFLASGTPTAAQTPTAQAAGIPSATGGAPETSMAAAPRASALSTAAPADPPAAAPGQTAPAAVAAPAVPGGNDPPPQQAAAPGLPDACRFGG